MASNAANEGKDFDLDHWDPMAEHYNSPLNTLAFDPLADPTTAIDQQVKPVNLQVANTKICEFYARHGHCADKKYCDKIHIDGKTRDRLWKMQTTCALNRGEIVMKMSDMAPLEMEPDPSALYLMSVSSVKLPTNFQALMPFERINMALCTRDDIQFYIQRVEQTSPAKLKLQKFHTDLASIFDHPYRTDNINDELFLTQVVACKLEDGRFRRAVVVDLPDLSMDKFHHKLFLMDVGIEVQVFREQIYDIKSRFLNDPPLAANCRLNVKPVGGHKWQQEAIDRFEDVVRGQTFWLAKILDYDKRDMIFTVDLFDLEDRESITNHLINVEKIALGF